MRQRQGWDPLLDWAARDLGVTLTIGEGVVPVPQPAESLDILQRELDDVDDFGLAAAHDLISLSGSLILAFAVMRGHLDAARAWDVSRVDEDWQISQWGADEDATAAAAVKRAAFVHAERFYHLSRPDQRRH